MAHTCTNKSMLASSSSSSSTPMSLGELPLTSGPK